MKKPDIMYYEELLLNQKPRCLFIEFSTSKLWETTLFQ